MSPASANRIFKIIANYVVVARVSILQSTRTPLVWLLDKLYHLILKAQEESYSESHFIEELAEASVSFIKWSKLHMQAVRRPGPKFSVSIFKDI